MMNFEESIRAIAGGLASRESSFLINKGYVDCDLSGTFTPSCGEMLRFSAHQITDPMSGGVRNVNVNDVIRLRSGQSVTFGDASTRLFYEILKRNSNFDFIEIRIHAAGTAEVSAVACTDVQDITVQRTVLEFGSKARTLSLPVIDLLSLPENGYLAVNVKGISENSYVHGFRYIGKVSRAMAHMGERIVVFQTVGNKVAVLSRLKTIGEALGMHKADVLKRTVFIIYDMSEVVELTATAERMGNLRIIVLRGACYGTNNASLLISLILQVGEFVPGTISEVLFIDDNAQFDAETLVRQDAFITGRKLNVITTGVVHNISTLEGFNQYKGNWDYTVVNAQVPTDGQIYPGNLHRHVSNFISLPYGILQKYGVPLPLIHIEDYVEMCLRYNERDAVIALNPNINIWSNMRCNSTSNFYSILCWLISNSKCDLMDQSTFFVTFMGIISKIAAAGNYLLLRSLELALEIYSHGSVLVSPQMLIAECSNAEIKLEQIFNEYYIPISTVTTGYGESDDIIDLEELLPPAKVKMATIFRDAGWGLYNVNQNSLTKAICNSLVACINHLHSIAHVFDEVQYEWHSYHDNFDHKNFWNSLFSRSNAVVDEVIKLNLEPEGYTSEEYSCIRQNNHGNVIDILPDGFTVQSYLDNNPDVMKSGMDAIEHWFKYGQFEGRKF